MAWQIIPYLRVEDGAAVIDWCVKAFGAVEKMRVPMPDGSIGHAELDIEGATINLAGGLTFVPPETMKTPLFLYVQVADVDAAVDRTVKAGATLERPVANQEYGFRSGGILDPFGHRWYFSGPIR